MNDALLEVNLLIASVVENHIHPQKPQTFLRTLDRFNTTPMTSRMSTMDNPAAPVLLHV
jgi:hypothetical protein